MKDFFFHHSTLFRANVEQQPVIFPCFLIKLFFNNDRRSDSCTDRIASLN